MTRSMTVMTPRPNGNIDSGTDDTGKYNVIEENGGFKTAPDGRLIITDDAFDEDRWSGHHLTQTTTGQSIAFFYVIKRQKRLRIDNDGVGEHQHLPVYGLIKMNH